jgi:hypothetical protein
MLEPTHSSSVVFGRAQQIETDMSRNPLPTSDKDPDLRPSEDDIQREKLGPRGVPGAPDPARMTPQRHKKTPTDRGGGPEHTA